MVDDGDGGEDGVFRSEGLEVQDDGGVGEDERCDGEDGGGNW